MDKSKIIKPLLILLIVIAGSAFLIRSFTSSETLLDYANENNIPVHTLEDNPE